MMDESMAPHSDSVPEPSSPSLRPRATTSIFSSPSAATSTKRPAAVASPASFQKQDQVLMGDSSSRPHASKRNQLFHILYDATPTTTCYLTLTRRSSPYGWWCDVCNTFFDPTPTSAAAPPRYTCTDHNLDVCSPCHTRLIAEGRYEVFPTNVNHNDDDEEEDDDDEVMDETKSIAPINPADVPSWAAMRASYEAFFNSPIPQSTSPASRRSSRAPKPFVRADPPSLLRNQTQQTVNPKKRKVKETVPDEEEETESEEEECKIVTRKRPSQTRRTSTSNEDNESHDGDTDWSFNSDIEHEPGRSTSPRALAHCYWEEGQFRRTHQWPRRPDTELYCDNDYRYLQIENDKFCYACFEARLEEDDSLTDAQLAQFRTPANVHCLGICSRSYHASCLGLPRPPSQVWFCDACSSGDFPMPGANRNDVVSRTVLMCALEDWKRRKPHNGKYLEHLFDHVPIEKLAIHQTDTETDYHALHYAIALNCSPGIILRLLLLGCSPATRSKVEKSNALHMAMYKQEPTATAALLTSPWIDIAAPINSEGNAFDVRQRKNMPNAPRGRLFTGWAILFCLQEHTIHPKPFISYGKVKQEMVADPIQRMKELVQRPANHADVILFLKTQMKLFDKRMLQFLLALVQDPSLKLASRFVYNPDHPCSQADLDLLNSLDGNAAAHSSTASSARPSSSLTPSQLITLIFELVQRDVRAHPPSSSAFDRMTAGRRLYEKWTAAFNQSPEFCDVKPFTGVQYRDQHEAHYYAELELANRTPPHPLALTKNAIEELYLNGLEVSDSSSTKKQPTPSKSRSRSSTTTTSTQSAAAAAAATTPTRASTSRSRSSISPPRPRVTTPSDDLPSSPSDTARKRRRLDAAATAAANAAKLEEQKREEEKKKLKQSTRAARLKKRTIRRGGSADEMEDDEEENDDVEMVAQPTSHTPHVVSSPTNTKRSSRTSLARKQPPPQLPPFIAAATPSSTTTVQKPTASRMTTPTKITPSAFIYDDAPPPYSFEPGLVYQHPNMPPKQWTTTSASMHHVPTTSAAAASSTTAGPSSNSMTVMPSAASSTSPSSSSFDSDLANFSLPACFSKLNLLTRYAEKCPAKLRLFDLAAQASTTPSSTQPLHEHTIPSSHALGHGRQLVALLSPTLDDARDYLKLIRRILNEHEGLLTAEYVKELLEGSGHVFGNLALGRRWLMNELKSLEELFTHVISDASPLEQQLLQRIKQATEEEIN